MPESISPQSVSRPGEGQKYFIRTFGCQMNAADSERMASLLSEQGMSEAKEANDADVILINGCSVREKAVHKAVSTLGEFNLLKKKGKGPLIGVGGCVGQLDKQNLFKKAPYLDFVFGTDTLDQLPEMLYRVRSGERHVLYTDFDSSENYSTETKVVTQKAQAFVNIMKGCDKYCTYCIVPYTRGREKSRVISEVLDDVARLVATGVREVTLLGQNVNSFGKGNPNTLNRTPLELHNPIGKVGPKAGEENFPQLLRAIDQDPRLTKLKRIRFTSSHPLDFSDELIDCYQPVSKGGVSKLSAHLHLPVQSGSNAVLQKMGRHHKIETYIEQMQRLKTINPEIGLSTDLIVGFPTETEEDFEQTLKLLDTIEFDNIYAFAYSPRPGTRASKLKDDVSKKVKSERLNKLLAYQIKIAERRYQSRVGKVMEVLVEGPAKNQNMLQDRPQSSEVEKVWTGHTECNRVVNFVAKTPRILTGKFAMVKITGATGLALSGELDADARGGEVSVNDPSI